MRIVNKGDEPLNFPGVCVFTRDAEGPFLDTDTYLNARELDGVDPYAYIHVTKVKDMGRAVGMVEGEKVEALEAELEELRAEVEANAAKAAAWDALSAAREKVPA